MEEEEEEEDERDHRFGKFQPLKIELECPVFNGGPSSDKFEFRTFLKRFEFCTATLENEADKLLHLKSKLQGRAFKLIANLDVTSDNYVRGLNLLKEKFRNTDVIRDKIFEEILPQPENSSSTKNSSSAPRNIKKNMLNK